MQDLSVRIMDSRQPNGELKHPVASGSKHSELDPYPPSDSVLFRRTIDNMAASTLSSEFQAVLELWKKDKEAIDDIVGESKEILDEDKEFRKGTKGRPTE